MAKWPNRIFRSLPDADLVFEELNESARPSARTVFRLFRNAFSRQLQMIDVIEQTYKCRRMARTYPWRTNAISRSDHMYFVWFSFTNHCYLFRERAKLFFNDYNRVRRVFQHDAKPVALPLKSIDAALGEHIRHRGQHVHEYKNHHVTYDILNTIEWARMAGLSDKFDLDPDDEFRASKWHMGHVIEQASDFMINFVGEDLDDQTNQFEVYAKSLDDYLDRNLLRTS